MTRFEFYVNNACWTEGHDTRAINRTINRSCKRILIHVREDRKNKSSSLMLDIQLYFTNKGIPHLCSLLCAYISTFSAFALVSYCTITVSPKSRGELPGLDQFLDRTSTVYSILLYTVASSLDFVNHQ